MKRSAFNTFKAIFLGFVSVVVLSVATDAVLEKVGFFPPAGGETLSTGLLMIALAYRSIYTVVGGYVTAKLSPDRPMRHVAILGIIGTIAGTLGVIAGWNLSAHWYPILLAASAYLFTWLGGRIQTTP